MNNMYRLKKKILLTILTLFVLLFLSVLRIFDKPEIKNNNALLFDTMPRLTNVDKLSLIHCSNICIFKKPNIIILIHSHVTNFHARYIIRRSFPRDTFQAFNAQLVFLVAVPNNYSKEIKLKLYKEFRKHEDLVQGEFLEAYRNLTYKHLMGLRWVRDFCNIASVIVKMDDDIVANYYKLFEILNKLEGKFDLLGHEIIGMKPIRNDSSKWYVSYDEFPASEYPSFLSGWMYVMTTKASKLILKASLAVPFFWIDDVFITGILRERANLKSTDISLHFRYEPKNLECCISNKYSCDFLAAPNGKNFKLNLDFMIHLWECKYKKRCVLESNKERSCLSSTNAFNVKGEWSAEKINFS